jgi:hypothetical protein
MGGFAVASHVCPFLKLENVLKELSFLIVPFIFILEQLCPPGPLFHKTI